MDKPIPEAVAVTLHQDRAGCEWIIVTSKDHPGSESEVTPSDDPALFDLLKALTAAQQQGQAAPPSAPVGVEGMMERAYEVVHHDVDCPSIGGDGDADCRCDAVPFLRDLRESLAQQPAAVDVSMVSLTAIKDAIRPLTDGRSTRNVHTRQVARDILQRLAALATQHQEPTT